MRLILVTMLSVALCVLAGCQSTSKTIHVSIPQAPIAEDTATVVLFYQPTATQNPLMTFELFIDDERVGELLAEEPWQLELTPGQHTIEGRLTGTQSEAFSANLKAGSIQFLRVRKEYGTFMDTVYVEPSEPTSGYIMISHR